MSKMDSIIIGGMALLALVLMYHFFKEDDDFLDL
jgi:hypothetical protein